MTCRTRFLCRLMVALALVGPAHADRDSHDSDHDRARQAFEAGEVLPLRDIIERLARDYPGQLLEVELEREHGRWMYEIKLLANGGELVKLKVDAQNGNVLGSRGQGRRHREDR